MCSIDKYIIVSPFSLRPGSHGTEQNMGAPWRKEAAVKSYITIPTLFTVQQSFSSVRHGKEVYRFDDMIWLIDLIQYVQFLFFTSKDSHIAIQNLNVIIQVQSDVLTAREDESPNLVLTVSIMSHMSYALTMDQLTPFNPTS